jgi:hypothetical protein
MRKDFWPEIEVSGRFEDLLAWRLDDNGVAGMHEEKPWRLMPLHDKLSHREDKFEMALEMKDRCEKCSKLLAGDSAAWICVYECTFCPECTEWMQNLCPNCGGELVRRPRAGKVTSQ